MDHFTSRKASRRDPKPGLGLDPDHDLAFWLPFRPPCHVLFFCFLLVSVVTLSYFIFIARPSLANWALLLASCLALIYSNYFGFAVLGCVALEYDFRSSQDFGKSLRFLLASTGILLVAYLPIINAFWYEAHRGTRSHGVALSFIANGMSGM